MIEHSFTSIFHKNRNIEQFQDTKIIGRKGIPFDYWLEFEQLNINDIDETKFSHIITKFELITNQETLQANVTIKLLDTEFGNYYKQFKKLNFIPVYDLNSDKSKKKFIGVLIYKN